MRHCMGDIRFGASPPLRALITIIVCAQRVCGVLQICLDRPWEGSLALSTNDYRTHAIAAYAVCFLCGIKFTALWKYLGV